MDSTSRSHRRAVWLIVAVLLALVAGLVGHELNWLRERRAFWAQDSPPDLFAAPPDRLVSVRFQELPLSPPQTARLHWLVMWLFGERARESVAVPFPRVDPCLLSSFAEGGFPGEAFEDLDSVRRAHWLFPEARIEIMWLNDHSTGLPVAADPVAGN